MEKSRSQKTGSKVNPALSEINGFGHPAPLSLPCVRQATRAVMSLCGVADGKGVDTGVGSEQIICKEPTCGIPSSSQWVRLPRASAASEHPKCRVWVRLRDVAQWAGRGARLVCSKLWGPTPEHIKLGEALHAERGGSEVQSHPWLRGEFKANRGFLRPSWDI